MSDDTKVDPQPEAEALEGSMTLQPPTEFSLNLRIRVSAPAIVKAMGSSAPTDTHDLIIELEQEVGLWALTILLARYFEGQMAIAREQCPELIGKTDDELVAELEECE